MSLQRQFPNSNKARMSALTAIMQKMSSLQSSEDMPLTIATQNRVSVFVSIYTAAYEQRTLTLTEQVKTTESTNTSRQTVRLHISHFIQVFNFGVERGKYKAQDRVYYGLPNSSSNLPPLTSEADLILWGKNLIKGDADRIAAGGEPMSNPKAEELQIKYVEMLQLTSQQSSNKNAYDKAQENLEGLNAECDKLIMRVWNEINTFYDDHEASSRRRKAREWGVVFVSTNTSNLVSGTVLNVHNDQALANVEVYFSDINEYATTDANGKFSFRTNFVGMATFEAQKTGFVAANLSVEIEEDTNPHCIIHLSKVEAQ